MDRRQKKCGQRTEKGWEEDRKKMDGGQKRDGQRTEKGHEVEKKELYIIGQG